MNQKHPLPEIVIVVFSHIQNDARVLRQIEYLAPYYQITVLSYGELAPAWSSLAHLQVVSNQQRGHWRQLRTLALLPLGRLFPQWAYERWYWGRISHSEARRLLEEIPAHIIHANDWNTLPLAVHAARKIGAKIVLDLHEYAPLEGEDRWHWRVFVSPMIDYFLRKYGGDAAAYITVNETIAHKYQSEYSFLPTVVMNTPQAHEKPPFRATNEDSIHLIHHGGAKRDRQLELMIQTIAYTDKRFILHFMLLETDKEYMNYLKGLAQQTAPERIYFHSAVPPQEIVSNLASYDMGFYLLPFTNYNNSVALPNKFFDFIMAGLAVCIGPSPEMSRLTNQFKLGIVSNTFDPRQVARQLNALSISEINQYKVNAVKAREFLNADVEMQKLVTMYKNLLNDR